MNDSLQTTTPKKLQTRKLQAEIEDKFIELLEYFPPKIAAEKAGYSKDYARNIKYEKANNPKFLAKLKKRHNGNAHFMLPYIGKSDNQTILTAIQEADDLENDINEVSQLINSENDPDIIADLKLRRSKLRSAKLNILSKSSNTRKEIKQQVGVLQQEGTTQVNLVNIESIQAIVGKLHDDKRKEE